MVYERNLFVKIFTVLILSLIAIMSVFLLVLAVDHVMVRPRQLQPDTVGYSVSVGRQRGLSAGGLAWQQGIALPMACLMVRWMEQRWSI